MRTTMRGQRKRRELMALANMLRAVCSKRISRRESQLNRECCGGFSGSGSGNAESSLDGKPCFVRLNSVYKPLVCVLDVYKTEAPASGSAVHLPPAQDERLKSFLRARPSLAARQGRIQVFRVVQAQ